MTSESQIPMSQPSAGRRFAIGLGFFYAALFGLLGAQLPFFPVWLKAIGTDSTWIGIIIAVPAVTRFTVLPVVTGLAQRRQSLRAAIVVTSVLTALGFGLLGSLDRTLTIFAAFALTACMWTPILPLTDAYALRGIARHRLDYGPLRLWGSAAFVAGALGCGLLLDRVAAPHLIWIIAGLAAATAMVSLGLQPLEEPQITQAESAGSNGLLRQPAFLAIIIAAALIQGSHAAYYTFASIDWRSAGLGGVTIAGLWTLGVLAEIVVFAISPRFRMSPAVLVAIGASSAVVRWLVTAQQPPVAVLAIVQLLHGLSYGLTLVGTMALLARHVPLGLMPRAQGYLAACAGLLTSAASVLCGAIYARYGQGVYYVAAAMAASGLVLIWVTRLRLATGLADQPQSAGEGG